MMHRISGFIVFAEQSIGDSGELMVRPTAISGLILLLAGLSLAPAVAGEMDWEKTRLVNDRFNVTLGTYLADLKTDAGVGTSAGLGTTIRLEDDLGIDDGKTTFRLGGFWRFKPKHSLNFGYFALNRKGVTVLDQEIEFQGVTYVAQGAVASNFDARLLALTYQYSFVNSKRTEAGFTAGLSVYDFDVGLAGEIEINDGTRQPITEEGSAEEGIIAPIPTVGLFIRHGFRPNLVLSLRASFLNLDVGDFLGRVVDTGATLDWFFSKHVGIGVGTNTSDIQFESTGGDTPFRVAYRQSGFTGYLSFGF
jgi:hypothetical protein